MCLLFFCSITEDTDSTNICDTLFSHELQNMLAGLPVQGRTANNTLGYFQGRMWGHFAFQSAEVLQIKKSCLMFFLSHTVSEGHKTIDFYAFGFTCQTHYSFMYKEWRKRKNTFIFFF